MIARIGYFGDLTPEQQAASEYNLRNRFKAAITSQEGYIAGYWLRDPDGRMISFSVWESLELGQLGGQRANAIPLLPGQDGSLIPSPERVVICEVFDHF